MSSRTFEFTGSEGQSLTGSLEVPSGRVRAWAVFAHCFTCTRESLGAVFISRALARRGIGVLRFDFTGLGDSEGDFGASGIGSDVADLKAACQAMEDDGRPVSLLVGHSLGGAAVLHAAGDLEGVDALVTIGAPADPAHVLHLLGDDREEVEEKGCANVNIGGRPFEIRRRFIEEMEDVPWKDKIAALRQPLLIMHSPLDRIVGVDNAAEIFQAAKHPKSFMSLDNADHLLSKRADAGWAADMIAAWSNRYLDDSPADKEEAPDGTVRTVTPGDSFRTEITAGAHRWVGDEPKSVGGGDEGPNPYDMLGAALGTCTGMTLGMYARHKKLPLASVTVDVTHDRIHANDCEDCEKAEGKVDRFRRILYIDGDLDEDQRRRLKEIADRCPVHRTLENEIHIETELEDEKGS